jgi:tetratricopeptide (TPR) repeat protein
LINLRRVKKYIAAVIIIFITANNLFAVKRLIEGVDYYMKGKYLSAGKKVLSYIDDNPDDALAHEIEDMINITICSIHLKKAFALLSKEQNLLANNELKYAAKRQPEYTKSIEELYSQYLQSYPKEKAANRVILDLLNNPEPTQDTVYEISRKVREKLSNAISQKEYIKLEDLRFKIGNLKKKKKWNEAVDAIIKFMANNPGSIDVKVMLSEINRLAAMEFYEQAVYLLEKAKIKKGLAKATISKEYDGEWFEEKISLDMGKAKNYIAKKNDKKAKKQLKVINYLDPDNPEPKKFLEYFNEDEMALFEISMELYMSKEYGEAKSGFDFLKLRQPNNMIAQIYFHLSSARKFITELKLEKVKEHLIKVLQIAPDEKEAIDVFDRLQDVLMVMGKS